MHWDNTQTALLSIIRQSLWSKSEDLPTADWEQVENLARKQGVLSLLYLGCNRGEGRVPRERIQIWRGAMLAGVLRNEQLNSDQEEVIRLLEAQSVRSVVLKGTSAARFYPYPDARCLGDIDLLVDQSNLMQVEQVLAFLGYKKTDHEHKFHISYIKGNTTIEVHFAASEVPDIAGGYAVR